MVIKNLTPHPINIKTDDGEIEILPEEVPARCHSSRMLVRHIVYNGKKITVQKLGYGPVINLPPVEEGVILIVSKIVKRHPDCRDREDILSVGTIVRDEKNTLQGCYGLWEGI